MKLLIFLVLGLVLVSSVSAYYCIYQEDNQEVKEFKNSLNILSIEKDLTEGLTKEQIKLKLKYFNPCR
jgi:hypothetical protein